MTKKKKIPLTDTPDGVHQSEPKSLYQVLEEGGLLKEDQKIRWLENHQDDIDYYRQTVYEYNKSKGRV